MKTLSSYKIPFIFLLSLLLFSNSVTNPEEISDPCLPLPLGCGDTVSGSTTLAEPIPFPSCAQDPGAVEISGVWYHFIGTGDEIALSTCGELTDFDTQINVYRNICFDAVCHSVVGSSCPEPALGANVVFPTEAGQDYLIVVFGVGAENGVFELTVNCPPEVNCAEPTQEVPIVLSVDAGPDQTAYLGYPPAECVTITAEIDGGLAPYSIVWSTGETTESITVCPTSSTTYSVTVDDNRMCTVVDEVEVFVEDISCTFGEEICEVGPQIKEGPGITVDVFSPPDGEFILEENEDIPVIIFGDDIDQILQTCFCINDFCTTEKVVDIKDAVSYAWEHPLGGGFLQSFEGPATIFSPQDLFIGQSDVIKFEVAISDSRDNDGLARVIFNILNERLEECKYRRTIEKIIFTAPGDPQEATPNEACICQPEDEFWMATPNALSGQVIEAEVKVCAGQRIVLKASGSDVDKLELLCKGGEGCDTGFEFLEDMVDGMNYIWTATGGGTPFPDYFGTNAITNGQTTSVIYQAPDQAGEYEVLVDIQDSGIQGVDIKKSGKIKVIVAKIDLAIENLKEEEELCPGAYICLNNDHDNGDVLYDKDFEGGPIQNENDLVRLSLSNIPEEGNLTLKIEKKEEGDIKIWKDPQKSEELTSFSFSATELPSELYLEGIKQSSEPGDVIITLENDIGTCLDEIAFTIAGVDLDIDSDNNNSQDLPDRLDNEDRIEDVAEVTDQPGKYICVNDGDKDKDGVPGWADGYNLYNNEGVDASGSFTPLILELPKTLDIDKVEIKFIYSVSDPREVIRSGSGTDEDPYKYTPPSGHLRIWKRDGPASRNKDEINSGGDFIQTEVIYKASDLDFSDHITTLYVEGIKPSSLVKNQQITVEISPNGDEDPKITCQDAVRVSIIKIDLDIDGVDDEMEESEGGALALNDDDDNKNNKADLEEEAVNDEDDLVKITLNVEPKIGPVELNELKSDFVQFWRDEEKNQKLNSLSFSPEELPLDLWVEGVKRSDKERDVELVLENEFCKDIVKLTVFNVDLVAHRAGDYFGQGIPESIENLGESKNFLLLVNNDREEGLPNFQKDFENNFATIPSINANPTLALNTNEDRESELQRIQFNTNDADFAYRSSNRSSATSNSKPFDDDLVKITLKKIKPAPKSGTLNIKLDGLESSGTVRLFKSNGTELTDSELSLDLGDPAGYLASILSHDIDIWLEGTDIDDDFEFALRLSSGKAAYQDDIHILIAEYKMKGMADEEIDLVPAFAKESILVLGDADDFQNPSLPPGISMPVFNVHEYKPLSDPIFYKIEIAGLPSNILNSLKMYSDLAGDFYEDIIIPSSQMAKSTRFACVYQAKLDDIVSETERSKLQDNLDINVIHFAGSTAEVLTNYDSHRRPIGVSLINPVDPERQPTGGRLAVEINPNKPIILSSLESTPANGMSFWNIIEQPSDANVKITGENSSEFSMTVDHVGRYDVKLTYSYNGVNTSSYISIFIDSSDLNGSGR